MQELYDTIDVLSQFDTTVLVTGETGTGKELVARAIHARGPRSDKRFLTINCAALPETLLEAELFGHEKGAFSGAEGRRIGKFEYGDGGTIFLDEIGDMPLSIQTKILRVLEHREFERLGGNESIRVDIRILAATNVDLTAALAAGSFRKDLYYRLNVVRLQLPPLRERKEDIPLLVQRFLDLFRNQYNKNVTHVSLEAMDQLLQHDWPGNVRELENALNRAFLMEPGSVIRSVDLTHAGGGTIEEAVVRYTDRGTLDQAMADFEKRYLEAALRRERGHIGRTAAACGITERTLHRRMRLYGLDKADYREGGGGDHEGE
jgi:transcriptional regulator with PAS, ATPase and Fis domain